MEKATTDRLKDIAPRREMSLLCCVKHVSALTGSAPDARHSEWPTPDNNGRSAASEPVNSINSATVPFGRLGLRSLIALSGFREGAEATTLKKMEVNPLV